MIIYYQPYTVLRAIIPESIVIYDEVWLHNLVPSHATKFLRNPRLNLSLDESELTNPITSQPTCSQLGHAVTTCQQHSTTITSTDSDKQTSKQLTTSQPRPIFNKSSVPGFTTNSGVNSISQ
ncbi:predicted protein [Naegleria gruberi]|uniref:Predicted protein n=1 Tax=Naegleria gruberi TaxID=5762 RepID=D2V669_NAEGR|nr:uncharacterized protein NAEGRDRAFT_64329 [Naegleria gruberi]EFC47781.1 predicted protein [Naegleria gruberi]|eukprot:XP_002680525.1 predicted protein [Naegleria gruberi strain NEG-M]